MDYFHQPVKSPDELISEIVFELIRIKNDYEAELQSAAADAAETVNRLKLDDDLTKAARTTAFICGDETLIDTIDHLTVFQYTPADYTHTLFDLNLS